MSPKGARRLVELSHDLIFRRDEVTPNEYEAQLSENLCGMLTEYAKMQKLIYKLQRRALLTGAKNEEIAGDKE